MERKQNGLFKKIAVMMVLAAMIVMNVAMTVFAEGEAANGARNIASMGLPTVDETCPVSLTLTKYEAAEGEGTTLDNKVTGKEQDLSERENMMEDVEFTVLKVATMGQTTDKNGTVSAAYKLTKDGAALLSKGGTTYSEGQQISITTLKGFIETKTARDAVFTGLAQMPNAVTAKTGADGIVKFTSDTSVASSTSVKHISGQGLYLVVETSAPDNVTKRTHPFFVSLPMSDRVDLNQWQYDVYAYPKNTTGEIDFDKKILAINDDTDAPNIAEDNHSADAYISNVITFKIEFAIEVPREGLTKLGIEDTMSKGLTFEKAESTATSTGVTIQRKDLGDTPTTVAPTNYTVSAVKDASSGKTTLRIEFTNAYISTLNNDLTNRLPEFEVEYKAALNEYAVLGAAGNPNEAHAYYRNTSLPSTEPDKKTDDDKTTVFTWGIDLTKRGEGNAALQGVEFKLANGDNLTITFVRKTEGNSVYYVPSIDPGATETLVTDSTGKLVIRGLKSDVYKLTETKTASGYILLMEPVEIVIDGDNIDGTAKATVNKIDVSPTADTLNTGSASALVPVTVLNNRGFILPSTGGVGTTVITMTGIVLVVISSFLLIRMAVKRRRKVSVE